MTLKRLLIPFFAIGLFSCGEKMNQVPSDKFVGTWELSGRSMFAGIQISIEQQGDKLTGKILILNENKLVRLFADSGDVWVSDISRNSNFQFKLTEKKIAKDLFSLYGISTSQEFKAEFKDDNTIGLASESTDPQQSTVIYKRVK